MSELCLPKNPEQADPLPEWFCRPQPVTVWQHCLFTTKLRRVLAELKISSDEVASWHAKEWLSFDGADNPDIDDIDDPRVWELITVRDVTRSGLGDAQVEYLLSQLPKPFAFRPDRLVFSFRHGWVEAVEPEEQEEPDPDAVIEEHLDSWLEECEQGRLEELRDRIGELLDQRVASTAEDDG